MKFKVIQSKTIRIISEGILEAKNLEEAREKAKDIDEGIFDEYSEDEGEIIDWETIRVKEYEG